MPLLFLCPHGTLFSTALHRGFPITHLIALKQAAYLPRAGRSAGKSPGLLLEKQACFGRKAARFREIRYEVPEDKIRGFGKEAGKSREKGERL